MWQNIAGDGTSNFTLRYPSVCMNPKILDSSLLCLSSDPRTPEGAELLWPAPSPARGQPFRLLSLHRQSPQSLWRPVHADDGRSCSSPWLHEPSGQWVTHLSTALTPILHPYCKRSNVWDVLFLCWNAFSWSMCEETAISKPRVPRVPGCN